MTEAGAAMKLRFEPPGPGSWEQDPVHFPRPMSRYFQETHPPAFPQLPIPSGSNWSTSSTPSLVSEPTRASQLSK